MWRPPRRRFRRWRLGVPVAVALAIAGAVALVSLPLLWPGLLSPPAGPPPFPGTFVNATLVAGPYVGTHYANPFFAAVFTGSDLSTSELQGLGAFYNSTPITVIRFGGGGDAYDPTTGLYYSAPPGGGPFQAHPSTTWNLTWLKSWCESRSPPCVWLGYLPGQENDTSAAVHYARWYHEVLGFAPTYWQFGNEPDRWTHYGENLSTWSSTDNSTPSALAYAVMVRDYRAAVAQIYPTDRFIGIEASCDCNQALITETAALNGPDLTAMAYHSYPGPPSPSSGLEAFYASLGSNMNLSSTSGHFEANVLAGCPTCGHLPVEVGEYQSGPPINHSPFALEYPGAPFLAASVIEALRANVSMFTEFDDTWLVDVPTGSPLPEGELYQGILDHLTMGRDYAANVATPGVGGVYSILIQNASRSSLLVIDTNTTFALNLSVPAGLFPVGSPGSEWSWWEGSPTPSGFSVARLPAVYQIPAQGILLVNNF